MNTDLRELNDVELEGVSGGMTCETARTVARIHNLTAMALGLLGNQQGESYYYGMADGVYAGGCR
jgi:hypothetical protein